MTDGWQVIDTLDMTGKSFAEAKPIVERLAETYAQGGRRVKINARSIIEILVATDA